MTQEGTLLDYVVLSVILVVSIWIWVKGLEWLERVKEGKLGKSGKSGK